MTREGRLFSVARSFRVLRVLRIFRLLVFFQVLKAKMAGKNISLAVAEHMQKVTILKCLIKAHLHVQKEICKFFGTGGRPDTFELVYSVMQSQCTVYEAMIMAMDEEQQLGGQLALEVKNMQVSKDIAERLEAFVCGAHAKGVVNSHEAESILSPMREHVKAWTARLRANHFGWFRKTNFGESEGSSQPDSPHGFRNTLEGEPPSPTGSPRGSPQRQPSPMPQDAWGRQISQGSAKQGNNPVGLSMSSGLQEHSSIYTESLSPLPPEQANSSPGKSSPASSSPKVAENGPKRAWAEEQGSPRVQKPMDTSAHERNGSQTACSSSTGSHDAGARYSIGDLESVTLSEDLRDIDTRYT